MNRANVIGPVARISSPQPLDEDLVLADGLGVGQRVAAEARLDVHQAAAPAGREREPEREHRARPDERVRPEQDRHRRLGGAQR